MDPLSIILWGLAIIVGFFVAIIVLKILLVLAALAVAGVAFVIGLIAAFFGK